MFITEVKKYRKDGVIYVGGEVPEGAEVVETLTILNAEKEHTLIRIADEEDIGSSVWLKEGDVKENYREEEHQEEING